MKIAKKIRLALDNAELLKDLTPTGTETANGIIAAKLEQVREALYTGLGCAVAVCCDESSAEQIKAALALFEEEAR